jgi:hypothetical protein
VLMIAWYNSKFWYLIDKEFVGSKNKSYRNSN